MFGNLPISIHLRRKLSQPTPKAMILWSQSFIRLLVSIIVVFRLCQAASSPSCSFVVSSGDAALGIRVVSDPNCISGGIGCIDSICRFCKTLENPESSQFMSCASFANSYTCTVSQGDYDLGVNALGDATCASGGLGCYNAQCRYCRFRDTSQSAFLLPCSSVVGSSRTNSITTPAPSSRTSPVPMTSAPPPASSTPAPTTSAPSPPPAPAPAITLECDDIVSSGDAASGIDIVTDVSCFEGGAGCFNNVCRYCKRQTTTRSAAFVDCISVDSTAGADISFVPFPVFPATSAPTPPTSSTSPCVVSTGDADAGIAAYTDGSCATGGLGCYSLTCRFCQQRPTPQSAPFVVCPSTVQLMLRAAAPTRTDDADFSVDHMSSVVFSVGVVGVGVVALLAFAARLSNVCQYKRALVRPVDHDSTEDSIAHAEGE